MKKNIYLVEGETEKYFIEEFKGKYFISGKIKKFNLWENDINKIIRLLKDQNVIVIYDTDTTKNIGKFKKNIEILKNINNNIILISQNKNFEDELDRTLNKSIFEIFNIPNRSLSEFKNKFLKKSNLLSTLERNNYDNTKIWKTKYMENEIIKVCHESEKIKINKT